MTDVSKFIITTDANTSKYLTDAPYTTSFSSSAATVAVGAAVTRTYTIPLSEATRLYAIWVNISLDGAAYIKIPNRDRLYASNAQRIATTLSAVGSNATLTLYLVNSSGSLQNFPAFTINIIRRDYVDEF